MKASRTYRHKKGAGFLAGLILLILVPFTLEGSPPGGSFSFHASFHAGAYAYTPVVSYSARIRMFAHPSVTVGFVHDPYGEYYADVMYTYPAEWYYTAWYSGGWYVPGGFTVTYSFGYPWYPWHPVWYIPVVVPWPGPYYSYHTCYYHWHGYWHGHGDYGYAYRHPRYDPWYRSYGGRSSWSGGEDRRGEAPGYVAVRGFSSRRPPQSGDRDQVMAVNRRPEQAVVPRMASAHNRRGERFTPRRPGTSGNVRTTSRSSTSVARRTDPVSRRIVPRSQQLNVRRTDAPTTLTGLRSYQGVTSHPARTMSRTSSPRYAGEYRTSLSRRGQPVTSRKNMVPAVPAQRRGSIHPNTHPGYSAGPVTARHSPAAYRDISNRRK